MLHTHFGNEALSDQEFGVWSLEFGEIKSMGEEGVSVEEVMDWEIREAEAERERERSEKKRKEDGAASVVRWEKFLPRMVLRVLLVEADDSTRQIIAALLRKCSYSGKIVSDDSISNLHR